MSEQELRRIIQACGEHAEKAAQGKAFHLTIKTILKDGSIVESSSTDETFTLENSGARRITEVHVTAKENSDSPDWRIDISFRDGTANTKSWESASLKILGQSRDWAFVTASDLEERMRRVKMVSWDAFFGDRYTFLLFPLLMLVGITFVDNILPSHRSHEILQQQYQAGQFHNPIEALIALEKIKNTSQARFLPLMLSSLIVVPAIIFFGLGKVLPMIRPSYNFYWSDYCALFDRRRQIRRSIWTVIILGFVVSVAAAVFTKKLGF